MLLHEIIGSTSFNYLKIVEGINYNTFQGACNALGLLDNDERWITALNEAAFFLLPNQMRELFPIMLVYCHFPNAFSLWEKFKQMTLYVVLKKRS